MSFFQQIKTGLSAYVKAFSFVFKNKMAWTLIIPLIINILLFSVAQTYVNSLLDYLKSLSENWTFIQNSSFLSSIFTGAISVITEILFFIIFAYIGGYIVLMIMSPFLSYLSEKTEQILTGNEYKFNLKQLIKDSIRGILMALRNMFLESVIIIPVFFAGFIPVIGLFTTMLMFLISAYFYGFSFIDYINERKKRNIKQSVKFIRSIKWIAIANGSIFALPLIIPVIGSHIAAFISIFSVVAATIAVVDYETPIRK